MNVWGDPISVAGMEPDTLIREYLLLGLRFDRVEATLRAEFAPVAETGAKLGKVRKELAARNRAQLVLDHLVRVVAALRLDRGGKPLAPAEVELG